MDQLQGHGQDLCELKRLHEELRAPQSIGYLNGLFVNGAKSV